jgi:hypothetical protein
MLNKSTLQSAGLLKTAARSFGYDIREIAKMNSRLQRKINVLRMFTDHKMFNYERPDMTYDKKTGDVTIIDPRDKVKKKKIIHNMDEVISMKQKLYDELGLDQDGLPKGTKDPSNVNVHDLSKKLESLRKDMYEEYEVDPNMFY